MRIAGRKLTPLSRQKEKTTALRLMALPTDRSMYPEIMRRVKAPLKIRIGTEVRSRLMMLSGLRKEPRPNRLTWSSFTTLKAMTISRSTI